MADHLARWNSAKRHFSSYFLRLTGSGDCDGPNQRNCKTNSLIFSTIASRTTNQLVAHPQHPVFNIAALSSTQNNDCISLDFRQTGSEDCD